MSEFSVPVVRIGIISKHNNADTLSTTVVEGETVVILTGDYQEGDLAIYVPVDAVVPPTVPGTEFLGEHRRIKAKRLRGIYSEGLLLPLTAINQATAGFTTEGDDVASILGITKHEDKVPDTWGTSMQGMSIPPKLGLIGRFAHWAFSDRKCQHVKDPGCIPVYDIESGKKYPKLLVAGEMVTISEKLHGTNARYGYANGEFYVGSRNNFWRDMDNRKVPARERFGEWVWKHILRRTIRTDSQSKNLYWQITKQYDLKKKLAMVPELAFFGEIYGQVQDLKYGAAPSQVWFRVFDIYDTDKRRWLNWGLVVATCDALGLETVPVLYEGPWDPKVLEGKVEGKSVLDAKTIREGVVVKPTYTRIAEHFGRVILKWVSEGYKLRRGPTTELH